MEALFFISELADDPGMEALLVPAINGCIDLLYGELSPADLALAIWLHPERARTLFEYEIP